MRRRPFGHELIVGRPTSGGETAPRINYSPPLFAQLLSDLEQRLPSRHLLAHIDGVVIDEAELPRGIDQRADAGRDIAGAGVSLVQSHLDSDRVAWELLHEHAGIAVMVPAGCVEHRDEVAGE